MSPFQNHHHETRLRLGCRADRIGPTTVYTHRDLPWRYFNHTVVVDWEEPASVEAAQAAARRMHSLENPASFEMETFEPGSILQAGSEFNEKMRRASEHAPQSARWAGVLKRLGCSECDRLIVMAQPVSNAKSYVQVDRASHPPHAGRDSIGVPWLSGTHDPSLTSPYNRCRISPMPPRAIDRQIQLHRAGFGAGSGRPASVDRLLVSANLHAGVQYLWARPPDHPEPVGSAAVMVIEDVAEFFALSVMPAYRGRGFGGQLIESSMEYARNRGCRLAYLHSELNSPATTLYQRLGFVPLWQQVSYNL